MPDRTDQPLRQTERVHPAAAGIDALAPGDILGHLLAQQQDSLAAVRPAIPAIAEAAAAMAAAVRAGGRLAYAGAGSSGLMAVADALELNGTFGIPAGRIRLLMAGGLPVDARMPGDAEDDAAAGGRAAAGLGAGDAVVCVSASGSTPYALGAARAARAAGAQVVAVANTPGAALFGLADVAVCLATPPEVVAGSTRMGAGTAQKACLNLMSTLMAVHLGAVHDGRMVGVIADNAKLRARAEAMVADLAGCSPAAAAGALAAAGGAVRPAVLIARGADPARAASLLGDSGGRLRGALNLFERGG